jgi:glycerol-3-phosphate acyltransferase PlsY
MFLLFIILFLAAYFIGAIPTGYWICKVFFGIDITKHGSGNIGASNVARIKGKIFFFPIFLIDAGKAFGMLYFSTFVLCKYGCCNVPNYIILIATALLLGNAYSIFIKFKGGKGVATSVGIIAFILPMNFFMLFAFFWLVILTITKQAFLASLSSMFFLICISCYLNSTSSTQKFLLLVIFLWLVFRHQSNIKKILLF